jgi:hypothetical protein
MYSVLEDTDLYLREDVPEQPNNRSGKLDLCNPIQRICYNSDSNLNAGPKDRTPNCHCSFKDPELNKKFWILPDQRIRILNMDLSPSNIPVHSCSISAKESSFSPLWQVGQRCTANCQISSFCKLPISLYSTVVPKNAIAYGVFSAVHGKYETVDISSSETGHPNMNCSQTS